VSLAPQPTGLNLLASFNSLPNDIFLLLRLTDARGSPIPLNVFGATENAVLSQIQLLEDGEYVNSDIFAKHAATTTHTHKKKEKLNINKNKK